MIPYPLLGSCLFFLLCSAFFSASETALFSIPREKVTAFSNGGKHSERLLFALLLDGQRTLYLLLLGNLFVNITLAGLIHSVIVKFAPQSSPLVTMFFATATIVVFGEMLPKNIALKHNVKIGCMVALPLYWGKIAVSPILYVVTRVNVFFLVQFRRRFRRPSPYVTAAELKSGVIDSGRKGAISSEEQEMLVNLLDRGVVPVAQCMEHRSRIVLFPEHALSKDALRVLVKKKGTRVFVYAKEHPGQVTGVVRLSTLLHREQDEPLSALVEPVEYVPDTMEAAEVIGILITQQRSEVAVVDEYGSFTGVVSIENGINHILKPVFSPLERDDPGGAKSGGYDGVYSGETEIVTLDWLPRSLFFSLSGARTLSGALTNFIGSIPLNGDKFAIEEWNFYILAATPVKIESVFIKKRHEYDN